MTVGSLFSGIGGFDLGFERSGYQSLWRCEIESFCRNVLTAKMPGPPIYGDVRGVGVSVAPKVDVLVGGFPCQDVSIAGEGNGLDGERSGLFFQMARIATELRPSWVVIENVPGLLSNRQGRDFATVLYELVKRGYGVVWRILDSQYFGVAQRRRRVFFVCRAGGARGRASAVLFESPRSPWSPQTGEETRSDVAATLRGRSVRRGVNEPGRGGEDDSNLIVGVHANQRGELRTSALAGALTSSRSGKQFEGVMAFNPQSGEDMRLGYGDKPTALCGGQIPALIEGERARALVASMHKRHDDDTDTLIAEALTASMGHHGHGSSREGEHLVANTLLAPNGGQRTDDLNQTFTPTQYGVRRLTPLECERVQGFPDAWTCLCGVTPYSTRTCKCPDTPRYKALGNAVTVPVAQWIAERIKEVERID